MEPGVTKFDTTGLTEIFLNVIHSLLRLLRCMGASNFGPMHFLMLPDAVNFLNTHMGIIGNRTRVLSRGVKIHQPLSHG